MVNREQVTMLAWHWLRCPQVLSSLQQGGLQGVNITRYDLAAHRVLWDATIMSSQYTGGLPQELAVMDAASSIIQSTVQYDANKVFEEVKTMVYVAFRLPTDQLAADYIIGSGLVRAFLEEAVVEPLLNTMPNVAPQERAVLLDRAQQAVQRAAHSGIRRTNMFDPALREEMSFGGKPSPTGIPWIDIPCKGGVYDNAFVGLLAGSGGGKTVGCVQLAAETMLQRKPVAIFCYEQGIAGDIATRMFSYVTGISREHFMGSSKDYSPEVHAALDKLAPLAEKYLYAFDMSGAVPGQGRGGVEEIDGFIGTMKQQGIDIEWVIVDWFGELMSRNESPIIKAVRDEQGKLDRALSQFNEVTKRRIVKLMLAHQLAPNALESKTPSSVIGWMSAQGTKKFSQLQTYTFIFGKKDDKSGCMWMNVGKARNAPPSHRIVQLDGDLNRITDMNDKMALTTDRIGDDAFFEPRKRDASKKQNIDVARATGGI